MESLAVEVFKEKILKNMDTNPENPLNPKKVHHVNRSLQILDSVLPEDHLNPNLKVLRETLKRVSEPTEFEFCTRANSSACVRPN